MSIPLTYEKKLLQLNKIMQGRITEIMRLAEKDIAKRATTYRLKYPKTYTNSAFWQQNRGLNSDVNKILAELQSNLTKEMETGIKESWNLNNKMNDNLVSDFTSGIKLPSGLQTKFYQANLQQLGTFLDRTRNGMNLSDRVWNLVNTKKVAMENILASGITQGRSASATATMIKQFEQNPTALFRRVRDENGILRLSQAAKNYHPGQGVYRSAYKNAYRLTRTENNMAYRTADFERRAQLDFVTGVTVKLSAAHPINDICDGMKGDYPKGFLFTGWHPACICYSTSKMLSKQEFRETLNTGVPASKYVTKIPKGASKYLKDNKTKLLNLKTKPYFLKDNFKNGIELQKKVLNVGGTQYTPINKTLDIPKAKTLDEISSIKELNSYVVDNQLSVGADFKGIDLKVAKEWISGIEQTYIKFPELKANMKFTGTSQARYKLIKGIFEEDAYAGFVSTYERFYPEKGAEWITKNARKAAKSKASKLTSGLRVNKNNLASSLITPNETASVGNGITLNKLKYKSYSDSLERSIKNISSKWAPDGTIGVKGTLHHEMGHQIDGLLKINKNKDIVELFRSLKGDGMKLQLSNYANTNIGEMIAEGWSEYITNPTPRPVATIIGQIIEKEYLKWKK